ncbi:penicillin acylase family protein [Thalassiella azotivora]
MPRLRLVLTTALAVLVVAALVVTVAVTATVRRPLPDHSGEVPLAGLAASVEVVRDDRGVPQVYADTAEDLFRAQGYVHAQDRFFEMDFRRHVTAGRLAELVGENETAIEADVVVRTLGWRRVAEAELPLLAPSTRSYLQAYADGVNDYLAERSPAELSAAYTVLDLSVPLGGIEPWEPLDSLTWLKAMAWDLRSNYDDELGRALTYEAVQDVELVNQLWPPYPVTRHAPIVPGNGTTADVAGASLATARQADAAAGPPVTGSADADVLAVVQEALDAVPTLLGTGEGTGSNSWVVSGDLTATGAPILANDPHLSPSVPSIWYQVGLHCREVSEQCPFDVAGYSFSGLPGVVIGHNADIGWGFTNMGADVTDFFLERVNGDTYQRDGAQVPLDVRTEEIRVAGGETRTITVRSTVHGPILSDAIDRVREVGRTTLVPPNAPIQGSGYEVSLAWTALTPSRTADALFALNSARGWEDFRAAAELFDVPAQNLVYADRDGNIGYQAPGRIPVRQPGTGIGQQDGTWPRAGWDSSWDWAGTIPFAELPSVLNPPEGFVVTANQAVAGPGYPHLISQDFAYGYRSQRIRSVIEEWVADDHPITLQDTRDLQVDSYNSFAAQLVPTLLQVALDEGTVPEEGQEFTLEAVDLLRDWDHVEDADSAAAAYYNAVWSNLLRLTFADEPGGVVAPEGGSRWFEVIGTMLEDHENPWWDDKGTSTVVEQRDQILGLALYEARRELTAALGKDPAKWRWGQLHQLSLEHEPLGGDGLPAPVRALFNPDPVAVAGGSSLVNATGWDVSGEDGYAVTWVPSMRMVLSLEDWDDSTWVDLTGVSGHPWSPHYDDQLEAWADGEQFPWPFSRGAVEEAGDERLVLVPSDEEGDDGGDGDGGAGADG